VSAVAVSVALLVSFGLWVTLHCALAYGLIRRTGKRWQLLWLLLPPAMWLAPYWGFQHRLPGLATLWIVSFSAYLGLLLAGFGWQV
jgi:hypothetical protein